MRLNRVMILGVLLTLTSLGPETTSVQGATAAQLQEGARAGLNQLYSVNDKAKLVGDRARAVLVFPKIVKAGFVAGAQRGDGVLFIRGKVAGYYNTTAASYGLQAGVQKFGYALFFMDDQSLNYLRKSGGWEVGSGPSIVVVDTGVAKSLTTTTLKNGVYAFFFSQKGLMAGLGLQGTKITRYNPSK